MKHRDANVELWRCFCMGAVVLGHVVYNNNLASMDGFCWHIPGFLLISGYFGIRLSWRKIIALLGIVYACYWLTIPYRWGSDSFFSILLPHGGWFLPFYLVLMLLSPILNAAILERNHWRAIMISVAILLLLGWFPTLTANPHVRMVCIAGLQGNGFLLMVSTYMIGAYLNEFRVEKRLPFCVWGFCFILGIVTLAIWGRWLLTNSFTSPVAIMTAVCGFMSFKCLPQIQGRFAKVVTFISPSMFGVYILHETCIRKMQYLDNEAGLSCAIFHALLLFLLCLLIDFCRRGIVSGVKWASAKVCARV